MRVMSRPHIDVIGDDKTVQAVLSQESYTRKPEMKNVVEAIEVLK